VKNNSWGALDAEQRRAGLGLVQVAEMSSLHLFIFWLIG